MGMQLDLNENILSYVRDNSLRETPLLEKLRDETRRIPEHSMQILPEQGQFLHFLVKLVRAKNALEIGVFTGYSSICIAEALQEGGKLIACDNSSEWTDIAKNYWKKANLDERIELRLTDACKTLENLHNAGKENYFDFIFIDADKENCINYYEACLTLLRPGGLMVFDNTLWLGKVADQSIQDIATQTIRKLNQKLHHDARVDLSLLPFVDGITLVCKK